MKVIILLSAIVLTLYSTNVSFASTTEESLNYGEKLMLEGQFLEIFEKIVVFLKANPSKNDFSLEDLFKEGVINQVDYEFIVKNKIKYNPPSTAGPHDNYYSIFDRDNEDGTNSHILYDLVDRKDPKVTKVGNISNLSGFVAKWYADPSKDKSLFVFNNKDFYYFTLCFWDNEHWNNQFAMLIDLPEKDKKHIKKLKRLMKDSNLKYEQNKCQKDFDITVLFPSEPSVIQKFCENVLIDIFKVSKDETINYTSHGFRFNNVENQ